MSYSQNNEEEVILSYLADKPALPKRFLDIGAHDGVSFSNTRALSDLGWGGTLVEPSPAPFSKLMDAYKGRTDVALVHAAVVPGVSPCMLEFADSGGDFVSTFDEEHRKLWAAPGADGRRPGVKYQPIYVAGFSISSLMSRFPGPYTFVNLDVEGINFELFQQLRLQDLGVELICVEYQNKLQEIQLHAEKQGYEPIHVTSENVILRRS